MQIFTAMEPLAKGETDFSALQRRAKLLDSSECLDGTLVGYSSQVAQNWITSSYLLAVTERASVIVAHRPGVMHPAVAARMTSTLHALSSGRIRLNIVTGSSPDEPPREGDYEDKDNRYPRATEYVQFMKRAWTEQAPFSFDGRFYKADGVRQRVQPLGHHVDILMGGESDAAVDFGSSEADIYMLWGEPLAQTKERVSRIKEAARLKGRDIKVSLSLRLFLADTDEQAWVSAKAAHDSIAATIAPRRDRPQQPLASEGRSRQVHLADEAEVHDDCFWTGIIKLLGGFGNSSALVGTPDRVLEALRKYVEVGIDAFLFSTGDGFGEWHPSLEPFAQRVKTEFH